jgi:SAM-dependent methyltransferase
MRPSDLNVIKRIEVLAWRELDWKGGPLAPYLALWRVLSQKLGLAGQGRAGFDQFVRGEMRGFVPELLRAFDAEHPELTRGVFTRFLEQEDQAATLDRDKGWAEICAQLQDNVHRDLFTQPNAARFYALIMQLLVSSARGSGKWRELTDENSYDLYRTMYFLLSPAPGQRILEMGCGTGTGLLAWLEERPTLRAIGLDKDPLLSNLARCSLLLFGHDQARIETRDLIASPLAENGELEHFDHVICHPPTGYKPISLTNLRADPFNRFPAAIIERGHQELLFTAHALKVMQPCTGKAALILPEGFLNSRSGFKLRRHLVEENLLDAVILLPRRIFGWRAARQVMLVLDRGRLPDAEVLYFNPFIGLDASGQPSSPHPSMIFSYVHRDFLMRGENRLSRFSKPRSLHEITSQGYNLHPLVMEQAGAADIQSKHDMEALLRLYDEDQKNLRAADQALHKALARLAAQEPPNRVVSYT